MGNYIFIQIFQVVDSNASNGSDSIRPFQVRAQLAPNGVFGPVPNIFLNIRSPGANDLDFTPLSYICLSFCW